MVTLNHDHLHPTDSVGGAVGDPALAQVDILVRHHPVPALVQPQGLEEHVDVEA